MAIAAVLGPKAGAAVLGGAMLVAFVALFPNASRAADPTLGDWMTPDGAEVQIAPCANAVDRLCGRITRLKTPNDMAGQPLRDRANSDLKLRPRPLVGLLILRDLRQVRTGGWTDGTIYDPGDGRTYDARLATNPSGVLTVSGCVLVICRDQRWRRPQ
ncbi:MAG TPA: DUF2147 domain-containing protein [Caulobacteraceae bacterium]|nr:DUF2147 domain-containing protein [Caulobacteraceae bacterium]